MGDKSIILRVKKRDNFTIIDNKLIRDPNLTHTSKCCLIMILSLPTDWKYSKSGLMKTLQLPSMYALNKVLQELILFGYHQKTRYKNNYMYYFYESSLLIDKISYLGSNGYPRKLTEDEIKKLEIEKIIKLTHENCI